MLLGRSCLFQGFSCCRNPSLYFIRDKRISFGTFLDVLSKYIFWDSFPKTYFPKFLGRGYCELSPRVLSNHSLPLAEKKQMRVCAAGI